MRRRGGVVLIGFLLSVPTSVAAQGPPLRGVDVDVEGGPVTALSLTLAPHTQLRLRGEAFESLERGSGGSLAVAAYLGERYAVRVRLAATSHREANRLFEDRTTVLDVWLELRWLWRTRGVELEAGPTVGFARVSRPVYVEPTHGFLAGVGVGATRPFGAGLEGSLALHSTWSSFNRPPITGPAPAGFDEDAAGHRVVLALGLGYRWPRGD